MWGLYRVCYPGKENGKFNGHWGYVGHSGDCNLGKPE